MHVDSPTDIGVILAELRRARGAEASPPTGAATQLATMNFVVFIDDPSHRPWVLERATQVANAHPSRLIVLDSTPATTGVDISATTSERGASIIVNERVDIGVASLDHAAIISLTEELSIPDLATVLWWSGKRLLASRTFSGLAKLATTVVVDSSGETEREETISELGRFAERFPGVALADLAFMRLAPWREMIAQFFDDPVLREDLFSLTGLEIESGSAAEALYVAGWLGSRLSWEATGRDRFRDRAGRIIPVKRIPRGGRRRVHSVVLRSESAAYHAVLSSDDESVVCLSIEGARPKTIGCVPLQNIANTTLIERAILERGGDTIFETSLETVRHLLG